MHESPQDPAETLPMWVTSTLSRAAESTVPARSAIMDRVRREAAGTRGMRAPMQRSRWTRRGVLSPFGAAAMAGALGLLLSVRTFGSLAATSAVSGFTTSASVIGDTVMPSLVPSLLPSLRDTMRIVEFVLRGREIEHAEVVGDFNRWRPTATSLVQRDSGEWSARVVVPRDMVRFAFITERQRVASRDVPPAAMQRAGPSARHGIVRSRIDSI